MSKLVVFRALVRGQRRINRFEVCHSRWSLQLFCQKACEYECDPSVPQGEGLVSLLECSTYY